MSRFDSRFDGRFVHLFFAEFENHFVTFSKQTTGKARHVSGISNLSHFRVVKSPQLQRTLDRVCLMLLEHCIDVGLVFVIESSNTDSPNAHLTNQCTYFLPPCSTP